MEGLERGEASLKLSLSPETLREFRGAKPLSYSIPPSLVREGGQGDRLLNNPLSNIS